MRSLTFRLCPPRQGFGTALSGTVKARETAREAEKAREKTAEKDRLTSERDLLQLQKEIRDLKADLGLE